MRNNKLKLIFNLVIIITVFLSCSKKNTPEPVKVKQTTKHLTKKRVLYVDSYHKGLNWSDGITSGILRVLNATIDINDSVDNSNSLGELKVIRMDTKRNRSEAFKKDAALKVITVIKSWKPDIVIASDDNASKYLIVPYFKNSSLPFVFCGVNWDVVEYGYPFENVTGMIEVQLINQIIKNLKTYSKGNRIAFIKGDDLSARKEARFFEKRFNIKMDSRFVNNFTEWKQEYLKLQEESDMIILGNTASISDWDSLEAKKFILANTKVPTGNWDSWMAPYSLITLATKPEEQGQWVAKTALQILNGKSPNEIPITSNKNAKVFLNMSLAKKLNIKFPVEIIQNATLIRNDL